MYTGEMTPAMPGLLFGYTPGFRSSSMSALGATGREILDFFGVEKPPQMVGRSLFRA